MKNFIRAFTFIFAIFFLFGISSTSLAQMDHSNHKKKETDKEDHSKHHGKFIRKSTVNGYQLDYHIINMKEKIQATKDNLPDLDATHHLMVYINKSNKNINGNINVRFLIESSDGDKQSVKTMDMGEGFGADLNLPEQKPYLFKIKIDSESNSFTDNFKYTPEYSDN